MGNSMASNTTSGVFAPARMRRMEWSFILSAPLYSSREGNFLIQPAASSKRRRVHAALSINDVIAAIDIERFTGDQLCGVHCETRHRSADIIDRHKAARRRLGLGLVKQLVEI